MQNLKQAALDHWETTVVGWLFAAAEALLPVLKTGQLPTMEQALAALALGVIGTMAQYGGKADAAKP